MENERTGGGPSTPVAALQDEACRRDSPGLGGWDLAAGAGVRPCSCVPGSPSSGAVLRSVEAAVADGGGGCGTGSCKLSGGRIHLLGRSVGRSESTRHTDQLLDSPRLQKRPREPSRLTTLFPQSRIGVTIEPRQSVLGRRSTSVREVCCVPVLVVHVCEYL